MLPRATGGDRNRKRSDRRAESSAHQSAPGAEVTGQDRIVAELVAAIKREVDGLKPPSTRTFGKPSAPRGAGRRTSSRPTRGRSPAS